MPIFQPLHASENIFKAYHKKCRFVSEIALDAINKNI